MVPHGHSGLSKGNGARPGQGRRSRAEVDIKSGSGTGCVVYTIGVNTVKYGCEGDGSLKAPGELGQGNESLLVPSRPWHPSRSHISSGEAAEQIRPSGLYS